MTYTDVKVNEDISPERFVFKAPEGVTVQDMDAPTPPPAPDNP
jgi:outer membrane lipoprotein-sorting protein